MGFFLGLHANEDGSVPATFQIIYVVRKHQNQGLRTH